jgi:dGTPase
MTHSLEVSCVGRTLGTAVGTKIFTNGQYSTDRPPHRAPADIGAIVEAASLAHDIGHPPFGHAGDQAICYWFGHSIVARDLRRSVSDAEFADLRHFDGNAQGFRRIAQLEKHPFAGGLNLTFATLASYIKYPAWSKQMSSKTGFFRSERAIVDIVGDGTGLARTGSGYSRHPLSLLVEAADDICYGFLDLEDAVEMKILGLHDVVETLLSALPPSERKLYRPRKDERSHRVVFARMRGKVFREAISSAVSEFFFRYEAILSGGFDSALLESASNRGDRAAEAVLAAKARAKSEVFPYDHKAGIELASYAVMTHLLDHFVKAAVIFAKAYKRNPTRPDVDIKTNTLLGMLGDHRPQEGNAPPGQTWTAYQCTRRVLDFITGMTDDFAIRVSRQLFGQIQFRT